MAERREMEIDLFALNAVGRSVGRFHQHTYLVEAIHHQPQRLLSTPSPSFRTSSSPCRRCRHCRRRHRRCCCACLHRGRLPPLRLLLLLLLLLRRLLGLVDGYDDGGSRHVHNLVGPARYGDSTLSNGPENGEIENLVESNRSNWPSYHRYPTSTAQRRVLANARPQRSGLDTVDCRLPRHAALTQASRSPTPNTATGTCHAVPPVRGAAAIAAGHLGPEPASGLAQHSNTNNPAARPDPALQRPRRPNQHRSRHPRQQ